MTAALRHRGPDGDGHWQQGPVALGHRRLSIIDLEGGAQPMATHDERFHITYNGEIYNYEALRGELEGLGARFRTRSDTEVILEAYRAWGTAAVERLRGMFAFAIVDLDERTLFLARDPFGIKPLVVRRGAGYIAFASELPALREVLDETPRGDLLSVEMFLRYQYIPAPRTIYEGVRKMPPGTRQTIHFDGREEGVVGFHDIEFVPPPSRSDDAWQEEAEAVLRDSVRAHLVADVPFGVFLSGGTDSTLVAALMSELLEQPVRAYSIGFEEAAWSELDYATEAAEVLGVEHITEVISEDAMSLVPELVRMYGEPFGDSSALPTWHVARLARRDVPMVLSGDGGDEGFGGYGTHEAWVRELDWSWIWGTFKHKPKRAWRNLRRRLLGKAGVSRSRWERRVTWTRDAQRAALWKPAHRDMTATLCDLFLAADEAAPRHDALAYAQYMDYRTYLPGAILTKVDIATMQHGLEARPPLIDKHVVAFAGRLPLDLRLGRRPTGQAEGKRILKRMLARRFRDEFVHRPKKGFAIPRERWFLPGREGRSQLTELLASGSGGLAELFEASEIQRLLERHDERNDHSAPLWLLLVLGHWMSQNPEVSFR